MVLRNSVRTQPLTPVNEDSNVETRNGRRRTVNSQRKVTARTSSSTSKEDTPPAREAGGRKRTATEAELELLDPEADVSTSPGRKNSFNSFIDFEQVLREANIVNSRINGNNSTTPITNTVTESAITRESNPVTLNLPQIRLADDDVAAHVPLSLKQKIWQGEYINLALLLKGAVELSEHCSGTTLRLGAEGQIETVPKECKDKIVDIEKWSNAFLIFMSIYLTAHTEKTQELIHYMFNIRECAIKYGGLGWCDYDIQFRLRQATQTAN